ncbi:MAG TPA: NAD-glutamate dehydrogenase [Hyphomicrobiaceae bacterium]|nr:NAD-glutamate dehydrogenase [Hyphomicrobiaceae bacterium]
MAERPETMSSALTRAMEASPAGTTGGVELFARLLLASTDAQNLDGIGEDGLAEIVQHGLRMIAEKPAHTHAVSISHVDARPGDVSRRGVTIIDVLNDDMPFLVDSVMGELHARGPVVRLVLHPIFKTRRDGAGRLEEIVRPGDRNWNDGNQESYISVHVDRLTDAAAADVRNALSSILADVRRAVTDWRAMIDRLGLEIARLEKRAGTQAGDHGEAIAFLRWLQEGQFTFLGMRDLRLVGGQGESELETVADTGLGILRDPTIEVLRRGRDLVSMTPEIRRFFLSPDPLIITKANVVARIHRRAHMDYIGIKSYDESGRPVGELRVVGLFTSRAYTHSPSGIPLLRRKVEHILGALGYPPESHAGKALINTLETFPRDELFQVEAERLVEVARGILDLDLRPRVRVFTRVDRFDRFVSALVYVPRDRYTTSTREAIGELLARRFNGRVSASYPHVPGGPLARVHVIIGRSDGATPVVLERELEADIIALVRTWSDKLGELIASGEPGSTGALAAKYGRAFSVGYAETFPPERAIEDIARIERLGAERPVAIDFYHEPSSASAAEGVHRTHAAIYRFDQPIPLSERVPVLENLGFRVIDERTYRITPSFEAGQRVVALHDMVLEPVGGAPMALDAHDQRLEDAFLAVLKGEADNDGYNRLIPLAGAGWQEAGLLRAYGAYLRQLAVPFGQRYLADVMTLHPGIARLLLDLFRARLDPDLAMTGDARRSEVARIEAALQQALGKVASLDEDRILRLFLSAITATVRTNVYLRGPDGRAPETIALKLKPREIEAAPQPRPFAEIWVFSPRLDALHLRFAPIARGGIRWSDRPQDFRTEVLGLCKAQQVKNAVIVPAGAKGGFVPKLIPRNATRDVIQREGVAVYETFVRAALSITDNIVDGKVLPPERVVRHDGDDPYFVVAADKGTATFSDMANAISLERGFWLGDAFASGGSAGYDHKKMAITARGGWECVKRHFREMDRDIQREPFTAAGVGDMSGDVFGNAMLLSPATRLIAAFDHRDIFVDPDPDAAVSFAERKRLFDLPRSSWADYNRKLISKGGGVYSRAAKSIELAPEARQRLGIAATAVTPAELMRHILLLDVDLVWFGGIGTYVRATSENDLDVGDRGNDAIRITGRELRAKVIGEGANLAMTQRGRIEYALRGGRLNTDFIDNSAGVNSSDQEVNIKIALGPVTRSGRLDPEARKAFLAGMTDSVAAACLRNNYQQSLALSLAERNSAADMAFNARLIRALAARGMLERRLESLPTDLELGERQKAGQGLTRPELAILLSYSKIALSHDLLASGAPDEAMVSNLLEGYPPRALANAYHAELRVHPLRREIIATGLTNLVVNRCGPSAPVRLADETGRSSVDVALAIFAARSILDLPSLWERIDALDAKVAGNAQLDLYARVQEALIRAATTLLRQGDASTLGARIETHHAAASELAGLERGELPTGTRTSLEKDVREMTTVGLPVELAERVAALRLSSEASAVAELARTAGASIAETARVRLEISDHLQLGAILDKARSVPAPDYYDRLAVASAEAALLDAQRMMTIAAIDAGRKPGLTGSAFAAWVASGGKGLEGTRGRLAEIASGSGLSVSRLTVAAAQAREAATG